MITTDELRILILARLTEASKLGGDPKAMIEIVDRITQLAGQFKDRIAREPKP